MKKEDKLMSRVLAKEGNSMANSSFRVYYGGASGAVPFRWESRPGTPKHTFSEASIPPLTPPPSYYFSANSHSKKFSKPTLFASFFPKKTRHSPSFSLSSGSSSSSSSLSSWSSSRSPSSSSPSSFMKQKIFKRRRFSEIPSLECSFDGEEQTASGSPTSTLWFGSESKAFRGCYQFVSVKKALLSMVGHGSAGRGTVN